MRLSNRITNCFSYINSPVGRILLQGDGHSLTGLFLTNHKGWPGLDPRWTESDSSFTAARAQLTEYFAGQRQRFDLPLKLAGTPFQEDVWRELVKIPFGTTITYAELAQRVGNPPAQRAVGNANGRNPISIIVPCHRVIGADGKLTGYGGGIDNKKWLLAWEREVLATGKGCLFDTAQVKSARKHTVGASA